MLVCYNCNRLVANHGGMDLGGSSGRGGWQMGFGRGEAGGGGRWEAEMGFLLWGGWDIKWG